MSNNIRVTVSYETTTSNGAAVSGWAYHLTSRDEHGAEHESDALPHTRRDVSDATLMRSLRRAYRTAPANVRRAIASLDASAVIVR
jgi:hypothetical protein